MWSVRFEIAAPIVALALIVAPAPAGAQPAPPSGPAVAGPANPPPQLKDEAAAAGRKRAACDREWHRTHHHRAKAGTPAYFAFIDRCMKRR